ncbi:hypothetical protein PIB30_000018 [Stylosanthes scabra]|uniref:Uncharacterized protein n=1 Tax=Stylosanthes scabra TaxID=79078 RepID=A0ABU6Q302_9FABA|nr:hypothetical protein [Stylosanthes scabra]
MDCHIGGTNHHGVAGVSHNQQVLGIHSCGDTDLTTDSSRPRVTGVNSPADLKVSRSVNEVKNRLYGWVEEAVLSQSSVIQGESLPELRQNIQLMEDSEAERDYTLEAAEPSDRELFTRLRVHLPFSDFQKDVMTRCHVAASQLHLNGWGFILAFERLFDPYEESIQEFKWHYFKVLAASGRRAFWLDDEGTPFSWVYWNPKVKDFTVHNLDLLEMAAFKFLVSLPVSLPKLSNFTCHWILDHDETEVGKFLGINFYLWFVRVV